MVSYLATVNGFTGNFCRGIVKAVTSYRWKNPTFTASIECKDTQEWKITCLASVVAEFRLWWYCLSAVHRHCFMLLRAWQIGKGSIPFFPLSFCEFLLSKTWFSNTVLFDCTQCVEQIMHTELVSEIKWCGRVFGFPTVAVSEWFACVMSLIWIKIRIDLHLYMVYKYQHVYWRMS